MPTYEYHCKCCNNAFEAQHSIAADPGAECPKCLVWTSTRFISSGTSFSLKGSGWGADNYSKKSSD